MPTLGDSGEGRTCTRRNSGLAILEVSGGQNQFPGGQADLINCPLYSGPGRRLSETPGTFWLGCTPFPRPNGQKGREPGEGGTKGGEGRISSSTLPALHLCVCWSSGCLLLGKLSGSGEGLGSFPDSPERSAGSIPVTASAAQSLSVSPESPARKENPCGTEGPRARCGRVPGVSPLRLAWDPVWGAGTEAPHLLRRVQALPFDGRGHWGRGRRAGRRGRSLCGAWLASCLDSDPLGCSGAAAPAPPLARSLRRRARPSTLKDSHRAPFKRQRERANHPAARRAAAEAGGRGAARPPSGGCDSCRCTGLNLPSRSRCRHRSRRRPVPIARSSRLRPAAPSPSHLRWGRGAGGSEGAAASGRGADRAALPGLPPLSRRSIFAQLPSVSGFISFFLITIQIQ